MPLDLRTTDVIAVLSDADQRAGDDGAALLAAYPGWTERLLWLLDDATPITYLPVLTVCLVARTLDDDVDVRRIQTGDEYSAALVGRAVVDYGRAHEVDMRTDSTNVMNSQPFVKQPAITADLSATPAYASFFEGVEEVQHLDRTQAADVLALVMLLGRQHWPYRRRRVQRNQVHQATQLPLDPLPDQAELCFIIASSSVLPFEDLGRGTFEFHDVGSSTKDLIDSGDGRFVLFRRGDGADPGTFVGVGRLAAIEEQHHGSAGDGVWLAQVREYEVFPVAVQELEASLGGWSRQRLIARITADDFERITRLGRGEEGRGREPLTVAALHAACEAEGLAIEDHVLAALVAALESGKHVILTGPPGTAKTTLAVLVARLAAVNGLNDGHILTTATAEWSTYDTIGGLTPRADGTLAFRYGTFMEALDQNRWLVVDELNRSNFDRAFGPLFTVLAGQDVVLQYLYDDREDRSAEPRASQGRLVRLRGEARPEDDRYHDVVVRTAWRMIGTINNFDKSLLFEMSFALMRRFAFVEVPAPGDDVFLRLTDASLTGEASDVASLARKVVADLLPLRRIKEVGPAVYLDAARMARTMFATSELSPAQVALRVFYALLLPQFEGIDEAQGQDLLRVIRRAAVGEGETARRMLQEVLGLDLGQAAERAEVPAAIDLEFEQAAVVELDTAPSGQGAGGVDTSEQ